MEINESQTAAIITFLALVCASATALSLSCPLFQYDTDVMSLEIEHATRDGEEMSLERYPETVWLERFQGQGCEWLAEASKSEGEWVSVEFEKHCFSYEVSP